jgi:hypothetical protein
MTHYPSDRPARASRPRETQRGTSYFSRVKSLCERLEEVESLWMGNEGIEVN